MFNRKERRKRRERNVFAPRITQMNADKTRTRQKERTGRPFFCHSSFCHLQTRNEEPATRNAFPICADPHHLRLSSASRVARQKVPDDLSRRSNADLDVIQFTESGRRIKRVSFHEKSPDRIERRTVLVMAELVQRFDHSAVQIPCSQARPTITSLLGVSRAANPAVGFMRHFDLGQRLRIDEIKTMPQIDNCSQNGRGFNFSSGTARGILCPAQRARRAVFPKINAVTEPVPRFFAEMKLRFATHDAPGQRVVAPVVAKNQGPGNHQLNWRFKRPVAVYIPVEARKRIALVREAAILLPAARSCRVSDFIACPLLDCLNAGFICHRKLP